MPPSPAKKTGVGVFSDDEDPDVVRLLGLVGARHTLRELEGLPRDAVWKFMLRCPCRRHRLDLYEVTLNTLFPGGPGVLDDLAQLVVGMLLGRDVVVYAAFHVMPPLNERVLRLGVMTKEAPKPGAPYVYKYDLY